MNILDRLPLPVTPRTVSTPDGVEEVKPYQIAARVSLSASDVLEPVGPHFPAILDTGLNHNFAIRQEHLDRWAGLMPLIIGFVHLGKRTLPRIAANIWIYRNEPGQDTPTDLEPIRLRLADGIIVYPTDMQNPARLPILGLRALVKNDLRLIIDGRSREVTLSKPPPGSPP